MSVSGVLASNMVASVVRAYVEGGVARRATTRPPDHPTSLDAGRPRPCSTGDDLRVRRRPARPAGRRPDGLTSTTPRTADWQPVGGGTSPSRPRTTPRSRRRSSMYGEVSPTNDAGAGILNMWAGSVLDDYQYTSNSGTKPSSSATASALADDYYDAGLRGRGSSTARSMIVSLTTGDFVRLTDDYDGDTGVAGSLYRFLGAAGERRSRGRELRRSVALGRGRRRLPVDGHRAGPSTSGRPTTRTSSSGRSSRRPTLITDSLVYALLSEVGVALKKEGLTGCSNSYYGLIDHNDVRTTVEAYIEGATRHRRRRRLGHGRPTRRCISATEDSYVVPWDGVGGVIAVEHASSAAPTRGSSDSAVTSAATSSSTPSTSRRSTPRPRAGSRPGTPRASSSRSTRSAGSRSTSSSSPPTC